MFCIGAHAAVSGGEDLGADVFLLVITLPSAAIGVVVGHLGAWLARRVRMV